MTQIVIAIALMAHGIGHILFMANSWGLWKSGTVRAGLFDGILHASQSVEGMIGIVWIIPVIGFVMSAWGLNSAASWWRTTTLISTLVSAALIGLWWSSLNTTSATFALFFDVAFAVVLIWQQNGGLISTP